MSQKHELIFLIYWLDYSIIVFGDSAHNDDYSIIVFGDSAHNDDTMSTLLSQTYHQFTINSALVCEYEKT